MATQFTPALPGSNNGTASTVGRKVDQYDRGYDRGSGCHEAPDHETATLASKGQLTRHGYHGDGFVVEDGDVSAGNSSDDEEEFSGDESEEDEEEFSGDESEEDEKDAAQDEEDGVAEECGAEYAERLACSAAVADAIAAEEALDEHQLKFGKALSDLKDNAAFHLRCMWRPRFWERAEEDPLSPLCVGYFMVSCNFTGMLCYVGKFGEDHVVVTEEWYGENPDKVNDEAEWRANAIGSLTRVVYASKEDEEIGGHFVPCEGCDLVETDSEEAGSSAEAGGAKAAAE